MKDLSAKLTLHRIDTYVVNMCTNARTLQRHTHLYSSSIPYNVAQIAAVRKI